MDVTLATEGTYPHSFGGVSVWCDQLVRGLPEATFRVLAITGTGGEKVVWERPDNLAAVASTPLWGPPAVRRRAPRGRARRRAADLVERLTAQLLSPPDRQQDGFEATLRGLFELAQRHDLTPVLRGEHAVQVLVGAWAARPPEELPATPTLHDALTALDLLEHFLRPLAAEPVRADVTHAVSNGLPVLFGLAARWTHGTPLLLTEHGIYLRERYLGFRGSGYRWPVKALVLAFLRRLCETGYRNAEVVAPGNQYNRRWEVRLGADPFAIHTVYNGVDPARFPEAGAEPAAPTVSWAGRIDPIKDLETLIRAFALVRAELPAARLRIFGGTPGGGEAYAARCRSLAADLGLDGAVAFEGRVENIRDAYAAGHVVVLSSISEGFPYTLIEAMTCARATVSTDVGGVREAVGDTGLVVPPRDPERMAECCLRLLTDDRLRHDLAERARQRALELFTVDRAVDTFRDLYLDLAASSPRVAPRRVFGRAAVPRPAVREQWTA
jgi:glycosyltransferase involved in cell wall biosynthesis